MHEKKRSYEIWKFATHARRAVPRVEEPGSSDADIDPLLGYLSSGGPALPDSPRKHELKRAFLTAAAVSVASDVPAEVPSRSSVRRPARLALLRAAAVAGLVVVLLFSAGFASTYAMPDNPLYSVKRLVERARVFLSTGGDSKTSALLASSEERLEELEFACSAKKKKWYYSIAKDAAGDIEKAYSEAEGASADLKGRFQKRARRASERLESLLPDALPSLSEPQQEALGGCLNRMRRRLGSQPGEGCPAPDGGSSSVPCQSGSCGSTCPGETGENRPDGNCPGRQGDTDQVQQGETEQIQQGDTDQVQQGEQQSQECPSEPAQKRGSEQEYQQEGPVIKQESLQENALRGSDPRSPR